MLAAVTFAASVVPTFVGGVFLSGLADRLSRRLVMITCDLVRASSSLAMTLPGMPLAVLVILLFAVTMLGTPFTSARAASYSDILSGDRFVLGTAITLTTYQVAQVVGFAAGGAIAGFFGIRTSLVADAATFAASAIITRIWMRARPAARQAEDKSPEDRDKAPGTGILAGIRLVFADPALRTPMLLGWLAAFYNAPEGVAAPLARELGVGAAAVGLLLAAEATGAALGAVAFSRLVSPPTRLRWMRPLAFMSCAVLALFALGPHFPLALLILFVSGVFDCYQVAASTAFLSAAPERQRSQVFGLAQAGMSLGQGAAMILAGLIAQRHSPSTAIAVIGAFGAIVAAVIVAADQAPWRAPRFPAGHPSKWPAISRHRLGLISPSPASQPPQLTPFTVIPPSRSPRHADLPRPGSAAPATSLHRHPSFPTRPRPLPSHLPPPASAAPAIPFTVIPPPARLGPALPFRRPGSAAPARSLHRHPSFPLASPCCTFRRPGFSRPSSLPSPSSLLPDSPSVHADLPPSRLQPPQLIPFTVIPPPLARCPAATRFTSACC